jgi:FlgD Ig-like domain
MPSRRPRAAAIAALAALVLIAANAGPASAAVQQPPGGPILVVTSSSDPFSYYDTEILRNEGFGDFAVTDVSSMTAQLAGHDTVVLARTALTDAQVSALTTWVQGGGNLIAMQPDKKLAPLLGLTDAGGTVDNRNLDIDTTQAPGAGITSSPLQFHGSADLYTAQAGTRSVATLTPGGQPAVSLRTVGSGHAAAFTYDLARSVVYTRQGNPSWAGQNRDKLFVGPNPDPVARSNDLFFGGDPYDDQPDWVDLNRVAVPQADEQQRLLANMIVQFSVTPTPRFWYLPRGLKAAIAITGDDHGGGGTSSVFDALLSNGSAACRNLPTSQALLDTWTCPRGTSYVIPDNPSWPIGSQEATNWNAYGFELASHTWFNQDPSCQDFTSLGMLSSTISSELAIFAQKFPNLPSPKTIRTHCISWSDWASQPKADLAHGIRLNADYYYFPPEWTHNVPGLFTGSGMPMRFADCDGSLIDVYQAATYVADDATAVQGAADNANTVVPAETKALIDNAQGATGYYGAFTVQVHTDFYAHAPGRDAVVAYAMQKGVPVISELQLLRWIDGRNASSFQNVSYAADGTLSFTVNQAAGAAGLQAMVPAQGLTALTHNGQAMSIPTQTIKGVSYAILPDASGPYTAKYSTGPGAAHVASSFTGSIPGGSGGGGACEDAGDPGENPGGGDTGGGNTGGGNTGGGNTGGGNTGGSNTGGSGNGGTGGTGSTSGSTGSAATTTVNETGYGQAKSSKSSTSPAFVTASATTFRPGSKRSFVVTVRLRRDARVVLTLRTPSGKIVRRLRAGTHKAGTVVRLRWDGKDARGRYVAAAKYGYSVTAVGQRYLRTVRGSVDVLTAR